MKILACRALFLFFLFQFSRAQAQTDCVDYDVASYPKVVGGISYDWNGAAWNFTNLKQHKVSGLNFGNGFFKGLLEYLPPSFSPANTSTKYPLIIFFHGGASAGQGTAADLCRLFKDRGIDMATHLSIPGRVERGTSQFTQTFLTETFEYIVVSPQFTMYKRLYNPDGTPHADNSFPSANEVEQAINYLVNTRYANHIDQRRIYLVGYSTGANMISEYVGSSVARAKRVAAVMPVSLCSVLTHPSNAAMGISATNIAQAKLKTWFVYCTVDDCGGGGNPAFMNVSQAWVTAIRNAGGYPPRFTMLTRAGPIGSHSEGLYNCSDTLAHDAWSRGFDPNFKASFVGNGATTNANDGVNLNIYEWFTQQISAVLPVKLTAFTARVVSKRVDLNWTTVDEKDNASFTIERSANGHDFVPIGSVPAEKNYPGEKRYEFHDVAPLAGLNFYRLVQHDVDGQSTELEIRKVLNAVRSDDALVYPNPSRGDLSVFVSLARAQKINLTVTGLAGKVLYTTTVTVPAGSSDWKIPAEHLLPGIYFLRLSGGDLNVTRQIVRQ